MNILITGAAGFVGKNLVAALQNIRDGKDRTHPGLEIGQQFLYDIDSPAELLADYPDRAFVFYPPGKQMAVVNGIVLEQVQKGEENDTI